MDEYEPITDELRAYVRRATSTSDNCWWTATDTQNLRDLCDAIDAVHAGLERDYARLKAERDSMAVALDAAQGEHAYAPESHYMMLPKDADGVPIHVGDVMEWIDPNGEFSLVCTVEAVSVDGFITWSTDCGRFMQKDAKAYHHYHAPTVEDVLREFVSEFNRDDTELCDEEIIERFAAKLRLAGEK